MVAWHGGTTDIRGPYLTARDRHGTYMVTRHQMETLSDEVRANVARHVDRITNAGTGRAQVHVWTVGR